MNLSHFLPAPAPATGSAASSAPSKIDLYLLAMSALFQSPAAAAPARYARAPTPRKSPARPQRARDCARR